jgi:hypothetical protein
VAAAAAGSVPAKAVWQQQLRHFMVSCPTGVQSVGWVFLVFVRRV